MSKSIIIYWSILKVIESLIPILKTVSACLSVITCFAYLNAKELDRINENYIGNEYFVSCT